jgi:hypothetical protein
MRKSKSRKAQEIALDRRRDLLLLDHIEQALPHAEAPS